MRSRRCQNPNFALVAKKIRRNEDCSRYTQKKKQSANTLSKGELLKSAGSAFPHLLQTHMDCENYCFKALKFTTK